MQSFCGSLIRKQTLISSKIAPLKSIGSYFANNGRDYCELSSVMSDSSQRNHLFRSFHHLTKVGSNIENNILRKNLPPRSLRSHFTGKSMTTVSNSGEAKERDSAASVGDVTPRIKFKRLDKTAGNIMRIINQEEVEKVRTEREIPDIRPGYIVQFKVEVPENKRRLSTVKGVVIARRNAGLNTTFRIRRQVAGVGVESLFHLYSPNIKDIQVLDKKKVRRAKLYYLREKMNALKK